MSASQYMANLRIAGLPDFYFSSAMTPYGYVPDVFRIIEEELTDDGVDFSRFRTLRWYFEPFPVFTLEDDTSFANGKARLVSYLNARTKFGDLTYTAGGVQRTFRRIKIREVEPHPQSPTGQILMPGIQSGYGASSGSAAVLLAKWTWQLTQVGQ